MVVGPWYGCHAETSSMMIMLEVVPQEMSCMCNLVLMIISDLIGKSTLETP